MKTTLTNGKPVLLTVKDLLHTIRREAKSPLAGQHVHLVGIGGSGMSGLAQMLLDAGAIVSGTDRALSALTQKLAVRGATIGYDQSGNALPQHLDTLVASAAIPTDHPELVAARARGVAIIKYAQMVGRVMQQKVGIAVAGAHGKSTTTALVAHLLLAAGRDPSFVIGATCADLGGSARSGQGQAFVVEACEYDRSFLNYHPQIGVILNIEPDHLDYYKDLDEITAAFGAFAAQIDSAGVLITAAGQPACQAAARQATAKVETFSTESAGDWQAQGIRRFQGKTHFGVVYKGRKMGRLIEQLPGRHNVGNCLAAAAAATHCGLSWDEIAAGVASYHGVDRRSQLLYAEAGCTVVDDYAHHPTEIRATLQALREHYRPRRLICIFQPHQHSRTRLLLDDFAHSFKAADITVVPDIYEVRDSPADQAAISAATLVDHITAAGSDATYVARFDEIVDLLEAETEPGDLIISMGAGPVWEVTHELVRRLRRRHSA